MIQIIVKQKNPKFQQTKPLPVSSDITIKDLKKLIQINFGIAEQHQKLTIIQHNYKVILIESFSLDFYCFQNNQEILIDNIEVPNKHFKSSLGIKKQSRIYNSSFIEKTLKFYQKKQQQYWNSIYAHNFILSLNKEYQIEKETELYNITQQFLQISKKQDTENYTVFLNKLQKLSEDEIEKIINFRDPLGWPAILYAIRNSLNFFVIEIYQITQGKVLDSQSHDGWTVLSYCIFQKNWKLLYKILQYAKPRQVQIETSKGSLSHYLLKYSPDQILVYILFKRLIDPNIINSCQQKALDLCEQKRKNQIQKIMQIVNIPFKPFGFVDEVQKNYFFKGWQNQYVKFDFETFSLQIFNSLYDIPFVIKRIIPIQQLKDIKFLSYNNFNEKFDYFKFKFNNKKYEYKVQSQRVILWKEVIKRFQFFFKYYHKYVLKKQSVYQNYINKLWKQINQEFTEYDIYKEKDLEKIQNFLNLKKTNSIQNFPVKISDFYFIDKLGSGAFANVFKVLHKKSNKIIALKTINKNNLLKSKTQRFALIEQKILKENKKTSFLITLHFAFQNNQFLYIAEDYCQNGDIETLLNKQPERNLPISVVKIYSAQILLALEELHDRNYIYRDLKPENILIDSEGYIKLADFGLCASNIKLKSQYSCTFCGTPYQLSPEMVKNKQSFKVSDFYSFGVLIYELLKGMPPFTGISKSEIYKQIKQDQMEFDDQIFTDSSIDLITKLTHKDPMQRIGYQTIQDIKNHSFYECINWEQLKQRQTPPPIQFQQQKNIEYYDINSTQKTLKFNQEFDQERHFENFDYISEEYKKFYKDFNQFKTQIKIELQLNIKGCFN